MIAWLAAALLAQEPPPPEITVAVQVRVSDLNGNLNGSSGYDYGDLWGQGLGLTLEGSYQFRLKKWSMGPYLSVGSDRFEGGEVDGLDADDLSTSQVLVGWKTMLAPDRGFFFDGRVGVGAVFWSGTDGTLGGADLAVVDQTTSFVAELAPHIGYSTSGFFLAAGFALRFIGGPGGGDLGLDTSMALVASFELELGFRF